VGIVGAAPGSIHHRALDTALGLEQTRGIDEHDLGVAVGCYAANGRSRGLHLVRDDRHLGADEGIDQRRLAGIGRADDGDEAAASLQPAHGRVSRSSSTAAANRSASRLLPPRPCAGCWPLTATSTTNTGACTGPSRPTSRYSGSGKRRGCAHSCSSVLGSRGAVCCALSLLSNSRPTTTAAAANPASRKIAPS